MKKRLILILGITLITMAVVHGYDIYDACRDGDVEILSTLIKARTDINAVDNFGNTPLFYASASADPEIVEYLLSLGADPDIANSRGLTPVNVAMAFNRADNLALLLDSVRDVNSIDEANNTYLHYAVTYGETEWVETFLKLGTDHYGENLFGETPSLIAEKLGNREIAKLLNASSVSVAAK